MSLQQLAAQHMASQGRGPDTQLVHMSPREVAGLQALAMAHGGSLSINPETGLPEAGFLDNLLPAIIGAGLMFATGGSAGAAIIPGLSNAATIGLGVGALQTARTGDLGKGIMAGLGAYGGAGLGAGLGGAGMTVANPQAAQIAAAQAAPAGSIGSVLPEAAQAAAAVPAAPTLSLADLAPAPPAPVDFLSGMSDVSAVEGAGVAGTGLPTRSSTFASRFAAMPGKDLAKFGLAAAAPVLTETPKTKMQEDGERFDYAFDAGRTGEGYVDPITGQRQYFKPTYRRLAGGGTVEEMSNANAIGANTGYPMANVQRNAYAVPYQQPMSENVVTGPQDAAIDPFTGAERMARGGISHLGDYSDGGRLLRGPGDGVSDSIPAMIGNKRPARLADGEFVIPARIVSELGNGSTEAGARKLYAMMDRVQRARRKTTGKNRVAANTRADKHLPA